MFKRKVTYSLHTRNGKIVLPYLPAGIHEVRL